MVMITIVRTRMSFYPLDYTNQVQSQPDNLFGTVEKYSN
jgi:hypothetical protein